MSTVVYNKLIRDEIDRVMTERGVKFSVRTLDETEYRSALRAKALEGAKELVEAKTDEEILGELADLQAVMDATRDAYGISSEALEEAKQKKRICPRRLPPPVIFRVDGGVGG